jgi:hypothetical protein
MSQSSPDQGNIFAEETFDPKYADERNFYKLEIWSKDGQHLTGMLWAGNKLEKAHELFNAFAKKRPGSHVIIRQRTRVIAEWPK